MRAAVDDTRGHGERLERYAGDAAVMAVMAKLRRFQVPRALPWHSALVWADRVFRPCGVCGCCVLPT